MPRLAYTADGLPFYTDDGQANPLPVELPTNIDYNTGQSSPVNMQLSTGMLPVDRLFGIGGQERYQTWPEKMVRSAITLPADVMSGEVQTAPGLRREDVTDIPRANEPSKEAGIFGGKSLAQLLDLYPIAAQPLDPLIERSQDVAGLMGGAPMTMKPGVASVGSGAVRQAASAVAEAVPENAPRFYSAVEHAINTSNLTKASPEQWLGTIANQKGVKPEEMDWIGLKDYLEGKKSVTKTELQDYVQAHKVELKEVNKNDVDTNHDKIVETANRQAGTWAKNNNIDLGTEAGNKKYSEYYKNIYENMLHNIEPVSPTKYGKWQLPGGSNYREKLLTLPKKEKSSPDWNNLNPFEKNLILNNFKEMRKDAGDETIKELGYDLKLNDELLAKQHYEKLLNEHQVPDFLADKADVNNYTSSHWDEPNILAHVRMNDRYFDNPDYIAPKSLTDKDFARYKELSGLIDKGLTEGKNVKSLMQEQNDIGALIEGKKNSTGKEGKIKSLHLEEIQSDWHQQGRDRGYKLNDKQKAELDKIETKLMNGLTEGEIGNPDMAAVLKSGVDKKIITQEEAAKYKDYSKGADGSDAVPNAPFKKSWLELSAKRMIREAAERGANRLSWTPAKAQIERYPEKFKELDSVGYQKRGENYNIAAYSKKGNDAIWRSDHATIKDIEKNLGKPIVEKILKNEGRNEGQLKYLEDLKYIPGEQGMINFYDRELPQTLEKIGKEYGVKVKEGKLSGHKDDYVLENKYGHTSRGGSSMAEAEAELARRITNGDGPQNWVIKDNRKSIKYIDIPQGLKDQALGKGFPLFSAGHMISPVLGNPFEPEKKKQYTIRKVDHVPEFVK